ncbi:hypothetical protein [Butyrivibrio sp. MC2013]|uniref:hypothetical protein n=1 Tax=Butyrivibrio sp. MC2013 TaxID=1280686 RepID=UPI0004077D34|nr:hypothetical protein [Butyrivibrio sp. MC2013]
MNLAIDCFKLIKEDPDNEELYALVKSLVAYLGLENKKRDLEHHIMILGNESNQEDLDVDGTSFLLMDGDPTDSRYLFYWETFGVAAMAPKLECDRVFYPSGRLPVRYNGSQTSLLFAHLSPGDSLPHPELMRRFYSSARRADRVITVDRGIEERMLQKVPGVEPRMKLLEDLGDHRAGLNELGEWWAELFRN